jgi:hypothetical protein
MTDAPCACQPPHVPVVTWVIVAVNALVFYLLCASGCLAGWFPGASAPLQNNYQIANRPGKRLSFCSGF